MESKYENSDIEYFVSLLNHPDYVVRTRATCILVDFGGEDKIPRIAKVLKNDDNDPETAEEIDDDTAIEAAIRKLVLRDILEREEEEDDSDRVQLATLHAAKGLEFPDVFLMGVEEELLPHKNSMEAETIEEERRLMYVGITRAKQQLTITYAKKRKQFGEFLETTPSRFLDELPDEHVHWHGRDELDPEVARQKGQDTLSALAAMLKGESV